MNGTYIVEVKDGVVQSQAPYERPGMQEEFTISGLFFSILPWVIAIILLLKLFVVVQTQTVKVIERLGKFTRMAKAGLSFKIPFIDSVVGTIDLRIQQLKIAAETKTKDNVFVKVSVAVQYAYSPEGLYDAYYKLTDEEQQMAAYVLDVVRSKVPTLSLDEVFETKDDIAKQVKEQLTESMKDFGINIVQTLVVDVEPAEAVRDAMNAINEAKRLREAAAEKGEADKVLQVKKAEGEAESKKLQGEGIAMQRKAIAEGIKTSIKELQDAGVKPDEINGMLLLTQYFDTMRDIGAGMNSKVVFLPSSPAGMSQFGNEIRTALESVSK